MKILWLRRMYPLFNFWPVKGCKCGSNVGIFSSTGDNAGNCFFNLLKAFNLFERKSVVKRVTIVKTRIDEGSGNSGGSVEVKSVTDAMEVTHVIMAGAGKGGNLFGKR